MIVVVCVLIGKNFYIYFGDNFLLENFKVR